MRCRPMPSPNFGRPNINRPGSGVRHAVQHVDPDSADQVASASKFERAQAGIAVHFDDDNVGEVTRGRKVEHVDSAGAEAERLRRRRWRACASGAGACFADGFDAAGARRVAAAGQRDVFAGGWDHLRGRGRRERTQATPRRLRCRVAFRAASSWASVERPSPTSVGADLVEWKMGRPSWTKTRCSAPSSSGLDQEGFEVGGDAADIVVAGRRRCATISAKVPREPWLGLQKTG